MDFLFFVLVNISIVIVVSIFVRENYIILKIK